MKRALAVVVCLAAALALGGFVRFWFAGIPGSRAWAGGRQSIAGDVNADGCVNLSDAVYLLNHLFLGGPAPAACPGATAPISIVIIVRHAERATEGNDPGLTPEGQARAERLAQVLRHLNIDVIIASMLRRTIETLQPLADLKQLAMEQIESETDVVDRLGRLPAGSVAVVAHHSFTILDILRGLGLDGVDMIDVGGSNYDNLLVVLRPASGPPQLLHLTYQ